MAFFGEILTSWVSDVEPLNVPKVKEGAGEFRCFLRDNSIDLYLVVSTEVSWSRTIVSDM